MDRLKLLGSIVTINAQCQRGCRLQRLLLIWLFCMFSLQRSSEGGKKVLESCCMQMVRQTTCSKRVTITYAGPHKGQSILFRLLDVSSTKNLLPQFFESCSSVYSYMLCNARMCLDLLNGSEHGGTDRQNSCEHFQPAFLSVI